MHRNMVAEEGQLTRASWRVLTPRGSDASGLGEDRVGEWMLPRSKAARGLRVGGTGGT